MTPGVEVWIYHKGASRPARYLREIRRGRNKGRAECRLGTGRKVIVDMEAVTPRKEDEE